MSIMVSTNARKACAAAEQTCSERIEVIAERLRTNAPPITSHPVTTSHAMAISIGFENKGVYGLTMFCAIPQRLETQPQSPENQGGSPPISSKLLKNGPFQPQNLAQRPGLKGAAPRGVGRLGIGDLRDMIQAGQIETGKSGREK